MNRIPTALRIAQSIQWAVTPEYLAIIEDIAAGLTDPAAVANQLGRPLEATRTVTYRDNVAIIPVHSVIFRRASMFDDLSGGAASIQTLALDFRQAELNPAIDTILFDFDSPGGEVNGTAELAQMIKRCQKRTVAYVGDTCASAAYWLASACKEIVMFKTASVGSVGVQAIASTYRDPNKKVFTSKQSPDKNARADTERGATLIQKEIDKTAQLFIEDVANYRGVSVATVLTGYGNGAMVMADEAIAAGMADRVSSFEDLMTELQQTGKPEAPSAYAVNDKTVLAFTEGLTTALRSNADDKENEDMNKELVTKMLAGLSETERAEVLASLGGTEASAVADATAPGTAPASAPAAPAVETQAAAHVAAPAPSVAPTVPAGVDIAALQAQLATERSARIASDTDAFVSSMKAAGKVTPAEEADVRTLFATLAGSPDPASLNQYKASIQARPASPMLNEQVASNGQLQVLGNSGNTDTRTEAEKEAALVSAMLSQTDEGRAAAQAVAAGEVRPAFKQFAISQ